LFEDFLRRCKNPRLNDLFLVVMFLISRMARHC
jgi:hypothetical protein